PFACVLGNQAFSAAHQATAQTRLVLPIERMERLLKGPVLRCASLRTDLGVVLAMSGEPFDIVMGTPPEVQFLQIDTGEEYLFRVYERFVLRIKDDTALYTITL